MWLCLNSAFLSIVEPTRTAKGSASQLLVRARRPGDIERVFPNAEVKTIDGRDYMFRALIKRETVARVIAKNLMDINYGNFKDSVADHGLHDAYAGCWHIMARIQPQRQYSYYSRPVRKPVQRSLGLPARTVGADPFSAPVVTETPARKPRAKKGFAAA